MEDQDSIRSKMRRLRIATGLSQFVVARKARIERTRLSLWEQGNVELLPVELGRLQRTLLEAMAAHVQEIASEFEVATA